MQSLETIQSLAEVDRKLIEHRSRKLFDCYALSDFDSAMSLFAPDATVVFPRRSKTRADSGKHIGLPAIRAVFRKLEIEYEILSQEVREILTHQDRVAVYRLIHERFRGTGRASTLISCDWLTFRDGLIVRLECVTRVVEQH